MRSILFVCTANICRSPTAEGVLRQMLEEAGIQGVEIDSAGTHNYRAGEPPFPAAVTIAKQRGYEISHLVARPVSPQDFDHFDAILAMDRANVAALRTIAPTRSKQKIELLLAYGDKFHGKDVPDPYGKSSKDFELAFEMIEDGCQGLTALLSAILGLSSTVGSEAWNSRDLKSRPH